MNKTDWKVKFVLLYFRQLYSGADSLKLASQLLVSIGKFSNLHGEDNVN